MWIIFAERKRSQRAVLKSSKLGPKQKKTGNPGSKGGTKFYYLFLLLNNFWFNNSKERQPHRIYELRQGMVITWLENNNRLMSYYIPRPVTPYKWGKNEGIQKQGHFNLYCLDSTQCFCTFIGTNVLIKDWEVIKTCYRYFLRYRLTCLSSQILESENQGMRAVSVARVCFSSRLIFQLI